MSMQDAACWNVLHGLELIISRQSRPSAPEKSCHDAFEDKLVCPSDMLHTVDSHSVYQQRAGLLCIKESKVEHVQANRKHKRFTDARKSWENFAMPASPLHAMSCRPSSCYARRLGCFNASWTLACPTSLEAAPQLTAIPRYTFIALLSACVISLSQCCILPLLDLAVESVSESRIQNQ